MDFIKKHLQIFSLFFFGLVIRLSIIFVDYSWDVNNHMVWAKDFLIRGSQNFYETQSSNVFATLTPNYPPLAIFIFVTMRLFLPLVHSLYWWLNIHIPLTPSNIIFFLEKIIFLAGLMKIPAILADLGIAFLIFLFAKKIIPKNKKIRLSQSISYCLIRCLFSIAAFGGRLIQSRFFSSCHPFISFFIQDEILSQQYYLRWLFLLNQPLWFSYRFILFYSSENSV